MPRVGMGSGRASFSARIAGMLLLALACSMLEISSARAAFDVHDFSMTLHDVQGNPVTQAAAHPDLTVLYSVNQAPAPAGTPYPYMPYDDGQIRDVVVDLPKGFYGNPQAVPQCAGALLIADSLDGSLCPPASQIGKLELQASPDPSHPIWSFANIYNLAPSAVQAAAFGASVLTSPVGIVSTITSEGQPTVETVVRNASQGVRYYGIRLTLWGTPGDPAHDAERIRADRSGFGAPSNAPVRPFLTNASDCSKPMVARLRASSWQHPDQWVEATDTEPAPTGCEKLQLSHTISAQPTDRRADTPSGYDVGLDVPQDDDVGSVGTPPLKRVSVTLPEGVSLSPSSANGLASCSDADLAVGSSAEPSCPDASKIGDVTITTPLLSKNLAGTVYVGRPTAESMFRIFMVVKGPGVLLKLRGTVSPDPVTGRLTAVFDDLPELPFSSMRMHLNGGPGAPLANPLTCGASSTTSQLTAWAGTQSADSDPFSVDVGPDGSPCPATLPFAPSFSAGLTVPTAGASNPFTMTIRRPDGHQLMSGVSVSLPPGLVGNVAGITRCDGDAAVTGACDPRSQVGVTTTESGSGSRPLALPGKVFLGGPYKGAPFSLIITVPAQAGPYDLGLVVVRSTLSIDPVDAHVTVVSDPLPTILDGVPLRIRTINALVNRPGFMVAPTSCSPTAITGQLTSVSGAVANVADRFQVGGCAALPVKPKLKISLTGRGETTDGDHPALAATLTMPAMRLANLKKVRVALPLSLALDPDNSQSGDLCEFDVGKQTIPDCPASSIVGSVTAKTPILDEPLTGPVYFIKNVRIDPKSGRAIRTLPTLAAVLRGEGITLVLRATSAVNDSDQLVSTFDNVPDAPVSSFQLNINGGKKDILVLTGGADICKSTQVAKQVAYGQSGRIDQRDIPLLTPDCPLKVVSKSLTAKAATLKITGLGPGVVKVSGKGLATTSRTIASASVATVVAKRTGGRPSSVRVSFTPDGSRKARTTTTSLTTTRQS